MHMARYKIIDRSPRFLPVVLDAQLMSGSFEYALDYLIDHQLDLGALDRRYRNDDTGSTAYDPRVLLKIILLAYSRGMISSRNIERACHRPGLGQRARNPAADDRAHPALSHGANPDYGGQATTPKPTSSNCMSKVFRH